MARHRNTAILAALIDLARSTTQRLDRHAGRLLLAGLLGVAWRNWRLWQRDKALADRLRSERRAAPALKQTPLVSVLVAAWNEQARIDAHLRSFVALRYARIELILCAGGDDGTLEQARRYACERVIVLEQQAGEGKQRALAQSFAHARGEIIYLTDTDCIYNDEALARLLAPLINEDEQAATGQSRPLDEQMGKILPLYVWSSDVAASARSPQYSSGMLGRNGAIRRAALERIGGLDFEARTGTDYQLAKRLLGANMQIRLVPESVVQSAYPETLCVYRHKQSRWLRNLLIHGQRYGAREDVRATTQTVATGAIMLLMPITAPLLGNMVALPWTLLTAHAATSKLRYALFAARANDRIVSPRLIVALLPLTLLDFAIWASALLDLLDPQRREQW